MKKVILILSVFALTACEKETPTPVEPTCYCRIVTQREAQGLPDYWIDEPIYLFTGQADCDKHGQVTEEWTTYNWLGVINHRRIYICD